MRDSCDLHVHTTLSDGTFTPAQIVKKAVELGLRAVAITDHDTVAGIGQSLEAAAGTGLEIIPGIEMSADIDAGELHMLGYFMDYKSGPLLKELEDCCNIRTQRIYKIVERLEKMGINIRSDEVFNEANGIAVGRPHVARVMLKKGYIKNTSEAFRKYIGEKCPAYVGKKKTTPEKVIEIIRKAGGMAGIAHPGSINRDDLIVRLIDRGLQFIEAYHPDHSTSIEKHYKKMAERKGLLVTGGSDFHGINKQSVSLGSKTVPYSTVEAIKRRLKL